MTKRYEKFEEWMLGKKVTHIHVESSGVIVGRPAGDDPNITVRVKYDEGNLAGDTLGAFLRNLEFLEEKPSEMVGAQENSQIDWQVGQCVWDTSLGQGRVIDVFDTQIQVKFGNSQSWNIIRYTPEGIYQMIHCAKNRTLFFSEPVITAEAMPPKKPFVPKLKEGEKVLLKTSYFEGEKVAFVRREEENILYYMFEDGTKDYSGKSQITVTRIGEEIKWEN